MWHSSWTFFRELYEILRSEMSFADAKESPTGALPGFKKFVSEDELAEQKRKRQEEWEKVRKPDEPEEAPEPEYESRSLFEQLEDRKREKDEEYEERHRLQNQVKGLEDDEADFLDYVSQRQMDITKSREKETDEVLEEFRNAVSSDVVPASLPTSDAKKPASRPLASGSSKKSQLSMLAGAIKRKSTDSEAAAEAKKPKPSDAGDASSHETSTVRRQVAHSMEVPGQTAQVVAILPGLCYSDSNEDSDLTSSDSDDVNTDVFQQRSKLVQVQGHSK